MTLLRFITLVIYPIFRRRTFIEPSFPNLPFQPIRCLPPLPLPMLHNARSTGIARIIALMNEFSPDPIPNPNFPRARARLTTVNAVNTRRNRFRVINHEKNSYSALRGADFLNSRPAAGSVAVSALVCANGALRFPRALFP